MEVYFPVRTPKHNLLFVLLPHRWVWHGLLKGAMTTDPKSGPALVNNVVGIKPAVSLTYMYLGNSIVGTTGHGWANSTHGQGGRVSSFCDK